eukprot:TRINITY_DN6325_c0_g4_i1.p1 TRINITY_DN6325_c0_g4~~TRINITY_DN6325_c0_g4_i1.p1  ORF type:complete len:230 (+),score=47.00 TRINITY_DN6325_c0_g4_i1:32-721(+)
MKKTVPLHKIKANLRDEDKEVYVLLLSGSLNPVHFMHIKMFELAKKKLEDHKRRVVGGFIAPSSEAYVNNKLGKEALNLECRNKLCSLAVAESNWIDVCQWGIASSANIKMRLETILRNDFKPIRFTVVELCGADFAVRVSLWARVSGRQFVCFGREEDTDLVKKGMKRHDTNPNKFHLIEEDLDSVSSTAIRKLMKEGKYEDLQSTEWLHPAVLQEIKNENLLIQKTK